MRNRFHQVGHSREIVATARSATWTAARFTGCAGLRARMCTGSRSGRPNFVWRIRSGSRSGCSRRISRRGAGSSPGSCGRTRCRGRAWGRSTRCTGRTAGARRACARRDVLRCSARWRRSRRHVGRRGIGHFHRRHNLRGSGGVDRILNGLVHRLFLGGEAVDVLAKTLLDIDRKFVVRNFSYAAIVGDSDAVILLTHNGNVFIRFAVFGRPVLGRYR